MQFSPWLSSCKHLSQKCKTNWSEKCQMISNFIWNEYIYCSQCSFVQCCFSLEFSSNFIRTRGIDDDNKERLQPRVYMCNKCNLFLCSIEIWIFVYFLPVCPKSMQRKEKWLKFELQLRIPGTEMQRIHQRFKTKKKNKRMNEWMMKGI